jgi:hypothetical protein
MRKTLDVFREVTLVTSITIKAPASAYLNEVILTVTTLDFTAYASV